MQLVRHLTHPQWWGVVDADSLFRYQEMWVIWACHPILDGIALANLDGWSLVEWLEDAPPAPLGMIA